MSTVRDRSKDENADENPRMLDNKIVVFLFMRFSNHCEQLKGLKNKQHVGHKKLDRNILPRHVDE